MRASIFLCIAAPALIAASHDSFIKHSHHHKRAAAVAETSVWKPTSVDTKPLAIDGIPFGFLPDDSSGGGITQHLSDLILATGKRFATFGRYAQINSSIPFTGEQIYSVLGDVLATNAIFEISLMPVQSWQGLTTGNNSQAIAACNVMKNLTDMGVPEVRLRFGHEMNYYQNDADYNGKGRDTYPGDADDFLLGFRTVARACKKLAPEVKMIWSPNFSTNVTDLLRYWPNSPYVDYVSMDWYPNFPSNITQYEKNIMPFYKKFSSDDHPFIVNEVGLHYNAPIVDKLAYLSEIIDSSKAGRIVTKSITWFNYLHAAPTYDPEIDFKLVDVRNKTLTNGFLDYVSSRA